MILVTGASGKLGRLVVAGLLKKVPASQIIAAVRDVNKAQEFAAQGVQVRLLDYNQPQTITDALQGAEKVLLISGNEIGSRVPQHKAVIDAAKAAGAKLLAYTSILAADKSSLILAAEHKATEEVLRSSGIPYVLLRNGWYIENYSENLGGALHAGAMLGSAKDGQVSVAARVDYADAAVAVLTGNLADHSNKTYELAGDQAYTMSQLAAEVARLSGKNVVYQDMPADVYSSTLQQFGVPKGFADVLANADVGLSLGELHDASGTLQKLIGRPTTPVADVFQAAIKAVLG